MAQRIIGIIAGTSEGKLVAEHLKQQYCCHVFCATALGAAMIDESQCIIHTGRLDYEGFCRKLRSVSIVIDASHPFAQEVTNTVKAVCRHLKIPYIRFLRETQTYQYDKLIFVKDKEDICRILNRMQGNIGFTTGSNTLPFYSLHVNQFSERAVARIMQRPSIESSCKQLIASPPFSLQDNLSFIKQYKLAVLVSKDSGKRGGVPEKIEACRQMNIPILLIQAPKENENTCSSLQELDNRLKME